MLSESPLTEDKMKGLLKVDGFDDCIIGSTFEEPRLLIYSEERMVDKLMDSMGMDYGEAWDYYSFNILGAYMGPQTPIYATGLSVELLARQHDDES